MALPGRQVVKADELPIADTAYLKALNLDPSFVASRVNLAGIYDLQHAQKYIIHAIKQNEELCGWIENTLKHRLLNRDLRKYLEWREPRAE